ncbi:SUMF1/EgtB/PvdO family nonheme iron enzyme [Novosphingobium sp.]|uniref:SUMF1/EgtB/PvdO family nonheme iron enzyme n=1 Tax=Novosphingobium sp. TaxID=1874826 RepID=UPI00261F6E8D|nr:SUMF1/EgtB/PvdO family nonheme iron enzyme [Novosphingobium sp.]
MAASLRFSDLPTIIVLAFAFFAPPVCGALPDPDPWTEPRLLDLQPGQEFLVGVKRFRWMADRDADAIIGQNECEVRDENTGLWAAMDADAYANLVEWRLLMEMEPSSSYVYRAQDGRALRVFVDAPTALKAADKRPALVFFFGGSWNVGWQGVFSAYAEYFARRGLVCFRVDYRVGSRDGAGSTALRATQDAREALRWIRSNAGRFGVDPDRLVTMGESAGGHLALTSALSSGLDATQPDPALAPFVKAIIAAYPVSDASDKRISPVDLLSEGTPPLFVTWGTLDPFAPKLSAFVDKAASLNLSPGVHIEQGAGHGYILSEQYQTASIARMDAFLTGLGILAPAAVPVEPPGFISARYQNGLIASARDTGRAGLRDRPLTVSAVAVGQRRGTSLVDISYNLAGDPKVSAFVGLSASRDGGATFSPAPAASIGAGSDYGAGVGAGAGKKIVWDSARQGWAPTVYSAAQIEVTATSFGNMVWIPQGVYTQGSPASEPGRNATLETQRQVTLTQSFFIQATEVTWAQWNTVRAWGLANGYTDLTAGMKGEDGDTNKTDFDPVTFVSWHDALKWLNARSEMEGLTPVYTVSGLPYKTGDLVPDWNRAANGYRLPTEAEWEYAARAGTSTAFYNGPITYTTSSPVDPNLNLIGWYGGNSGSQTHAVAGKAPNAWGLYDTAGNVWEWCWDRHGTYAASAVIDPEGAATGTNRAKRGGSWGMQALGARSAYRNNEAPGSRVWSNNFRPVRNSGFVRIPAGGFVQGSPLTEPGRMDNEIVRNVTLTKSFYLQSTEVSWALWAHVRDWAGRNAYPDLPPGQKGHPADAASTDQEPVTMVSWHDAVKWLNAWSEKDGLTPVYRVNGTTANPDGDPYRVGEAIPTVLPTANGYRLPTEAEWEYAARAESATALPNGAITGTITDANLDQIAWYGGNSNGRTRPVATGRSDGTGKAPNKWGLYDMLGNVSEWCSDWFFYHTSTAAVTDPTGPSNGYRRIERGGSWNDSAARCRPAMRIGYTTPTRSPMHGFRAARNLEP